MVFKEGESSPFMILLQSWLQMAYAQKQTNLCPRLLSLNLYFTLRLTIMSQSMITGYTQEQTITHDMFKGAFVILSHQQHIQIWNTFILLVSWDYTQLNQVCGMHRYMHREWEYVSMCLWLPSWCFIVCQYFLWHHLCLPWPSIQPCRW